MKLQGLEKASARLQLLVRMETMIYWLVIYEIWERNSHRPGFTLPNDVQGTSKITVSVLAPVQKRRGCA